MFSGDGLLHLCAALLDASSAWPTLSPEPYLPQLRELLGERFPQAIARGVTLAAPVVGLLLAVELGVGVMNRLMSELNAFTLSMALRGLIAALALHAAAPSLMQAIAVLAAHALARP